MVFSGGNVSLKSEQGFTMVEIIVVIVIISFLASLAVPGIQGILSSQRLEKAAKEMLANLRLAQQQAISQESEYRVIINHTSNTYYIRDFINQKTVKEVKLPTGIRFLNSHIVYFYANGTTLNQTIGLRNGDNNFLYIIIYRTGRMRISDKPPSE